MSGNSPEPPGVDTVEKGIKSITSLTKVLTEFLRWVAGMIRNRDWVGLLMFAIAVFVVFWGTKLTLATMVKQPIFYGVWGILGIVFLVGLIVELRTKPPIKHIYRDTAKRKAIKFLSSFEEEDAEIYARLQGYRDLGVILENIVRPEFSFGVLKGKSGCGKSSYVKAGLLATLNKTETYGGVYIKFSDLDSLQTVKDAFIDRFELDKTEVESLNFIELLKKGIETADQSCEDFKFLILVFDQFEQFFVYTDNRTKRDNFIQELVTWYEDDDLTEQVKILVSIREDWFARLDEIQEKLNYSLRIGSQSGGNSFYIKNFSPEEATIILSVMAQEDLGIAENDNQGFEREYIQEVLEKELASVSDALISPVDLQIIAETIKQQNTSAMRAFNRTVFQKIGGIEGLHRSFLETMLEPLGIERKKSAVQVLVALTNLEQQTRSPVQTLEQIQEKVKATITAKEVEKIVTYLQDIGLITVAEKEGINGFELSHEGMISAVIRLGEKIQDKAYRANQLLERRVNEWLGNRRTSRYYFNLRELWLIEQQKPYLRWGSKRQQKQALLQKSKQKIYRVLGVVGSIIFIVIGLWSWLNYTTTGMMTQVRWKLTNVSGKISDPQYQAKAAIARAKDGNFKRALQLSDNISDDSDKANVLTASAETYNKLKQPDKAVSLLEKALLIVDNIDDSRDKARTLSAIAETIGKLKDSDKAVSLLEKAFSVANNINSSHDKVDALTAIAETYNKLNKPDKAVYLLEKAFSVANNINLSHNKVDALTAIAETYNKLNKPDKALSIADNIKEFHHKVDALTAIAETYNKLNKPDKALFYLEKALSIADNIKEFHHKVDALTAIAETYNKLNKPDKALFYLEKAFSVRDTIYDGLCIGRQKNKQEVKYSSFPLTKTGTSFAFEGKRFVREVHAPFKNSLGALCISPTPFSSSKAYVLSAIAETIGKLKDSDRAVALLEKVLYAANNIDNSSDKARTLIAIAETIGKLKDSDKAVALLEKALYAAKNIDDSSDKARTLIAIAETIGKLKDSDKAVALLEKVLSSVDNIHGFYDQANALTAISETYSKLKELDKAVYLLEKAVSIADNIYRSSQKANALTTISESAANLEQWKLALKAYEKCPSNDCEVSTLATILTIYAEQQNSDLKEEESEE